MLKKSEIIRRLCLRIIIKSRSRHGVSRFFLESNITAQKPDLRGRSESYITAAAKSYLRTGVHSASGCHYTYRQHQPSWTVSFLVLLRQDLSILCLLSFCTFQFIQLMNYIYFYTFTTRIINEWFRIVNWRM